MNDSIANHSFGVTTDEIVEFWKEHSISPSLTALANIYGIVVAVCGIITVASNCFILLLILRTRKLWKTNLLLVLNIVLPNILLPPLVHTFTVIPAFQLTWTLSFETCQAAGFFSSIFKLNSWLSIAWLCFDRFFQIVSPFKYNHFKWFFVVSVLTGSWTAILLVCLPPLFGFGGYGFDPRVVGCIATDCSSWGPPYLPPACVTMAFIVQILADYIGVVPLFIYTKLSFTVRDKVRHHVDTREACQRIVVLASHSESSSNWTNDEGASSLTAPESEQAGERGQGHPSLCKDGGGRTSLAKNTIRKITTLGSSDANQHTVQIKREHKVTQNLTGLLLAVVSTYVPGTFQRMVSLFLKIWVTTSAGLIYSMFSYIAVTLFPAFILGDTEFKIAAKEMLGIHKMKLPVQL